MKTKLVFYLPLAIPKGSEVAQLI